MSEIHTTDSPKPGTGSTPSAGTDGKEFLSVRDLRIHFDTDDGLVKSVDGVSFDLKAGHTLGIVGESGSGKSVTSLGVMGLHNSDRARISGEIWLDGEELIGAGKERVRKLRGHKMAMIFQDPLSALHPYYSIGAQIVEGHRVHNKVDKKTAKKRAIEMLDRVGIPEPHRRYDDYPHQFSGGMRQRAMIAMALINDPQLLIADEPTTALDVTVQAQILDLLKDLQREFGSAIILITHDLGVVANTVDDLLVMYAGRAVERGTVREVLKSPQHPYTWGLLGSMPRLSADVGAPLTPIPGSPPSLLNPPSGCPFHPRCAFVDAVTPSGRCANERPLLPDGRGSACHLTGEQKQQVFIETIQPRLG